MSVSNENYKRKMRLIQQKRTELKKLEQEMADKQKPLPPKKEYDKFIKEIAQMFQGYYVPRCRVEDGFDVSFEIAWEEDHSPTLHNIKISENHQSKAANALAKVMNEHGWVLDDFIQGNVYRSKHVLAMSKKILDTCDKIAEWESKYSFDFELERDKIEEMARRMKRIELKVR